MRYVSQKDSYSCGPTAIINLKKWLGYKISYKKEIKKLHKIKGFTKIGDAGIYPWDLNKYIQKKLKKYLINYKRFSSIKEIDKYLKNKYSIILQFAWPQFKGEKEHYSFLIAKHGDRYVAINWADNTISRTTRNYLKKILKLDNYIWVFRRKE